MRIQIKYEDSTGYHSVVCDVEATDTEQAVGDAISEVLEMSPQADILETCPIE
jgi:hypothetical protein